jgi:putative ABC transport system permease protein
LNTKGSILAIDDKYIKSRNLKMVEGRNISPIELEQRATICLINRHTRQQLFAGNAALGEFVYIDGVPWEVVGVYDEQTGRYRNDEIEVLAPLYSLLRSAKGYSIEQIDLQLKPDAMADAETKTAIVAEMEKNDPGRKGLYYVRDQKDMFARNLEIRKVLSLIGTIVAGISLIVGGIGMMNVMLTSVAERTREIGLRRAVGARKKDILVQFLVESCVLSLSGGILGLILGAAIARILPFLFKDFFTSAPRLQPSFLFLAVGCGVLLGMTFGFYPAIKASRLSPAESLRSE